jgi:hypothetical protein
MKHDERRASGDARNRIGQPMDGGPVISGFSFQFNDRPNVVNDGMFRTRRSSCHQHLGTDDIREERKAATVLGELSLAALLLLAAFFARLATHREGQRSQSPLGNLALALETGPVLAPVQTNERFVDASQRRRSHLEQREIDASLGVGVGVFEVVSHLIGSGAPVANTALNLVLQLVPALGQHLSQVCIPGRGFSHV